MYYYVNGTVAEIGPNLAVIDCGGVGYACATTNYTLAQLKKGEKAKLYTYLHVREEIFDLYGFASQAELSSFKMLISVSGVGPKAALAILSSGTPDQLALSIVTGDEKALTGVPGIGKKTAERLLLELKGKLGADIGAVRGAAHSDSQADILQALLALGYNDKEAAAALKALPAEVGVSDGIKLALKSLAK